MKISKVIARNILEAGANEYLMTPVKLKQLGKIIQQLLA
jgi:hypothetical protein